MIFPLAVQCCAKRRLKRERGYDDVTPYSFVYRGIRRSDQDVKIGGKN